MNLRGTLADLVESDEFLPSCFQDAGTFQEALQSEGARIVPVHVDSQTK